MTENNTMKKAAKGLSLMLVVKLLSKFLQLFLNFEVIKKVEPTVFGLSTYFVTLTIFQTTLNKVLLPQVYQKRSGNLDDKKTKISAKNLMVIGFYISTAISFGLLALFDYLYSHKHPNMRTSFVVYTIANSIHAYTEACLVEPILEFDYKFSTISEAIGFSVFTFMQWILIVIVKFEPCSSFGISTLVSAVSRFLVVAYLTIGSEKYSVFMTLEKTQYGEEAELGYVSQEMVDLSKQSASASFVLSILREVYYISFLSSADFMGQLTLIRSFGNLIQRFIFAPINEISFNMYSKMYKEGKEDSSAFEKMKQLMSLVNFVYCIVLMIVLTYATPTAGFLLQFLVGNKWMSDVFVTGVVMNLCYSMLDGVSGHLETFGKSIFSVRLMRNYNIAEAIWMVLYFTLMYSGQIFGGCLGVIAASIILIILKIGFTMHFLTLTDFPFEILKFLKNIIPSLIDILAFGGCYTICSLLMSRVGGIKGFIVCGGIGVINLAFFGFRNRHKLLELKSSFSKTKDV